jgi:hypothetical protein
METTTKSTMTVMQDVKGHSIRVVRHRTYLAALRSMSRAQRRLYSATVWALPGGGYDIFPYGHPVPDGARFVG